MNIKTEKIRIYASAYKKLMVIEDEGDLRKNKLSLTDYYVLYELMEKLSHFDDCKIVYTINSNVANWFSRMKFKVTPPHEGNNVEMVSFGISIT
jgi:hypothetical protein